MPIGTFEMDENSNNPTRIFGVDEESSTISTGNLNMDKKSTSISTGNFEMDEESTRMSTDNLNMDKESTSVLTGNWEMNKEICNKIDISYLDATFAQELFVIVYQRRRPERKIPFIVNPITNSPLTPDLIDACRVMLHNKEIEMFIIFAVQTSLSTLTNIAIETMSEECISSFAKRYFCPKAFLWMCLVLCNNAALAYNRGIDIAPQIVMTHIGILLSWLRRRGEFSDDSWKTIEAVGEDIKAKLLKADPLQD